MICLLLVEDDASLGATLQERLQKEGYEVTWAQNAESAWQSWSSGVFDLVILDVGLPDGSGFDLAQKIKSEKPTPFLFVTAQSSAMDRLRGFEIGAEEFIPKPFHLKELLIRVKHVLEKHVGPKTIKVGQYTIHMDSMEVEDTNGKKEYLAAKDFALLRLLIHSAPRVLSRDQILNELWGEERFPTNRTVDNSVVRLRQILNDANAELIRSVRGVGYQWAGGNNGE